MIPSRFSKKVATKKKQNGKKTLKGQVSKSKQKLEMESTPKEQISELDKEILTIKINESESKLHRKKHLCSYMEEEMSVYKSLYNQKQLLKSESMKLLDKAFEDFSTEIFLLVQELHTLEHTYNKIVVKKPSCAAYQEKVQLLRDLEAKLEENLSESEKCNEEIPGLSENFVELQNKVAANREKFTHVKEGILKESETCLLRIQNDLNKKIDEVIKDRGLKLELLPFLYKTLFLSGWLSSAWLDFALQFSEFLQTENSQLQTRYRHLLWDSLLDKDVIQLLSSTNGAEGACSDETGPLPQVKDEGQIVILDQQLRDLENKIKYQQSKLKSMTSEILELENSIKSLEVSGETYYEKSYLLQIVYRAGCMLKREL